MHLFDFDNMSSTSCSKLTMVGLTVLLLLLISILSTDACSCSGKWAPHRLCCRDVVLRGEVQSLRIDRTNVSYQERRVYTVKVQGILKGLHKIKNISQDHNTSYVEIYTPPGGACGISLDLQQSYVVSASINRRYNRKIIESHFCEDWKSEWEEVPKPYKEFFPELETCKCVAANINCAGRFFLLLSMLLTVLNIK